MLWTLFAVTDPASTTQPSRRADLAATLTALENAGAVRPSQALDRSATSALPNR